MELRKPLLQESAGDVSGSVESVSVETPSSVEDETQDQSTPLRQIGEVEAVRDIQRAQEKDSNMLSVRSAPALQDLLHPEFSREAFTRPGGFRRQFIASQR